MSIKVHSINVAATIDGEWRRVKLDTDDDHLDPLVWVYDAAGMRIGGDRLAEVQPRLRGADAEAVRLAMLASRQTVRMARLRDAAKAGG